ncbi:MAG: hypothetical protein QM756_24500 [Polyangiaceae bacterium]
MKCFALLCALGALLAPSLALAENESWDGGYELRAERRSGFTASAGLGLGLGVASGYPNSIEKQNDPAYESSIGAGFGSLSSLWIGGALRDWFIFGLGMSGYGASSGKLKASGGTFILHVEAFPLWSLGGRFRDLSMFTEFGAGGVTIEGGPEKADGGLLSSIGLGASYELFRWGHFALGPTLTSNYLYSDSMTAYGVFAGVRTTFYGGP